MLNKSKLKSDIKKVFTDMTSDDDFANGLAKACKDFGESGSIVTTDGGTVSSGVFAGSGSGNITLTSSLMASPIKTCCVTMTSLTSGGDDLLATALGNGLLAMTNAGKVETTVTGSTTSSGGSQVAPYGGTAKGTISCSNTALIKALKDCFKDMKDRAFEKGFDGDDYFATKLSDNVYTYFTNGSVTTSGQEDLTGVTGLGTIS